MQIKLITWRDLLQRIEHIFIFNTVNYTWDKKKHTCLTISGIARKDKIKNSVINNIS